MTGRDSGAIVIAADAPIRNTVRHGRLAIRGLAEEQVILAVKQAIVRGLVSEDALRAYAGTRGGARSVW